MCGEDGKQPKNEASSVVNGDVEKCVDICRKAQFR